MFDPRPLIAEGPPTPTDPGGPPLSSAFVCWGWPPDDFPNGIVPYVADMVAQFRELGHRATVLAQAIKGVHDPDLVRDVGLSRAPGGALVKLVDKLAYRASAEGGMRRQAVRSIVAECRRSIAAEGLQVVEMEESFGWCEGVQDGLPIPVVVRLHGPRFLNGPLQGIPDDAAFRSVVRAEGRAIRRARAITAPSLDVLRRTRDHYGLPLAEARVIHPSTAMVAPADRWRDEAAEPDSIVFIGRFDRHKGGDLVVDAFAELARSRPDARLRFIGPDRGFKDDSGRPWPVEDYFRRRLGDLASSGRVDWPGAQPTAALAGIRRKAGVVVVASRYDNFPVTVLEAMAMGCPLVAPRVGGIPEAVEDGVNGLLFEAGDASDLAAKVGRVLDDRAMATRLGGRAAEDCEARHDPRIIAGQVAGFFREAIAGRYHGDRGGTA